MLGPYLGWGLELVQATRASGWRRNSLARFSPRWRSRSRCTECALACDAARLNRPACSWSARSIALGATVYLLINGREGRLARSPRGGSRERETPQTKTVPRELPSRFVFTNGARQSERTKRPAPIGLLAQPTRHWHHYETPSEESGKVIVSPQRRTWSSPVIMWRVLSAAATAAALLLFVGCGGPRTGSTGFAEQIAKARQHMARTPRRSSALARIGRSLVKAKDTSGAISTLDEAGVAASKITEAGERDKRLCRHRPGQISADNKIRVRNSVQKAKEAVAKIEDPADKARAARVARRRRGRRSANPMRPRRRSPEAEKIADAEADVSQDLAARRSGRRLQHGRARRGNRASRTRPSRSPRRPKTCKPVPRRSPRSARSRSC